MCVSVCVRGGGHWFICFAAFRKELSNLEITLQATLISIREVREARGIGSGSGGGGFYGDNKVGLEDVKTEYGSVFGSFGGGSFGGFGSAFAVRGGVGGVRASSWDTDQTTTSAAAAAAASLGAWNTDIFAPPSSPLHHQQQRPSLLTPLQITTTITAPGTLMPATNSDVCKSCNSRAVQATIAPCGHKICFPCSEACSSSSLSHSPASVAHTHASQAIVTCPLCHAYIEMAI